MTSPNTKSSLAVIIAVAGLLLTGWANATETTRKGCTIVVINGDTVISCPTIVIKSSK
jgi:hypothetical protein